MDVREKLVELLSQYFDIGDSYCYNLTRTKNAFACGTMGFDDFKEFDDETISDIADYLIDYGVTVQEWISVDDRLPQYTDEYNVTVGVPSEFGYFEKVKTLRFERIKGKEPRWVIPKNEIYNVIAWMELPKKYQPPKGE